MNISSAVRTAQSVITANSPVLLVGTAIAGVVTTGILAARGGYRARGIIDEAQRMRDLEEKSTPLTTMEKVQLTWLCYAVPAVTGASTIASVVGVHTIHTKRHAALAGLYAVTSGKLDDYREKAEEMLGTKKTQQLNDAIAQDSIDKSGFESAEVLITGGDELMYDDFSGRYFMGSVATIEKAIGKINAELLQEGSATLNEYYDKIGLPEVTAGKSFGWSGKRIEARFGAATAPNGKAAISVWFDRTPKSIDR